MSFKELKQFLTDGEFLSLTISNLFQLVLCITFFIVLIVTFIYKPIILLYFLILGMLVMGWFMLYFIFPQFHSALNRAGYLLKEKLSHWMR